VPKVLLLALGSRAVTSSRWPSWPADERPRPRARAARVAVPADGGGDAPWRCRQHTCRAGGRGPVRRRAVGRRPALPRAPSACPRGGPDTAEPAPPGRPRA